MLRRTRINPRSEKRKARDRAWARIRAEVIDRDGYQCQARFAMCCTGQPDHVHHRYPRGRGGGDEDRSLLVTVCWRCHDEIHHVRPADAEAAGLLLRSTSTGR